MRTRPAVMSALASVAVLVTGWELGAAATTGSLVVSTTPTATADDSANTPTPTPTPDSPTATPSPSTSHATGAGATPTPTPTTEPGLADGSYTGSAVTTRFGEVQVEITVAGGRITDVIALHLTDDDNRSVSISNRAAPILRQEVLAAQSADVQAVSGATYTSDAYLTSLQSAIDQAGR